MKRRFARDWALALTAVMTLAGAALAEPDAPALYREHCASCHGADRLGGQGPALLPENLGRLTGARAGAVIASGREATQMPGFAQMLGKAEIDALTAFQMRSEGGVTAMASSLFESHFASGTEATSIKPHSV